MLDTRKFGAIVPKYVDAVSNLITCIVKVNRTRTPQEMLDVTKRAQYTDRKVVDSMPRGEADPAFADEHPNGTHWKDADGKWCFATFDGWSDKRK